MEYNIVDFTGNEKLLSLKEAARRLGISDATLRNWVKTGIALPEQENPIRFSVGSVTRLRNLGRLTGRANRNRSKMKLPPGVFRKAVKQFHSLRLGLETAIYATVLKRLEAAGEVTFEGGIPRFPRRSMADAIGNMEPKTDERFRLFYGILPDPEECGDYLGEAYQAFTSIGRKARSGSYYTPADLVDSSLEYGKDAKNFLDPCCGTGRYLIRAAGILGLSPENLYGIEQDELVAKLAAINLLLAFPGREFTPNIFRGNALVRKVPGSFNGFFEFAATNPPWGAVGKGREESFSLFLRRTLHFLAPGGRLSFLLPESALNVGVHASLRRHLAQSCRIERITMLGRRFPGVFTGVLRLDAVNLSPEPGHEFEVAHPERTDMRLQRKIGERRDWAIETALSSPERELLEKVFCRKELPTLAGNAEWALGIVTGDNKRYLSAEPEPKAEPIWRGCDIFPGRLAPARRFLRPGVYQQAAPMEIYRRKGKLLYRFIANRPVVAVDNSGCLTLNSANILLPKLPGYTPEQLAAVLNSPLYGFLFRKRFNCRKILRRDLEALPLPPCMCGAEEDVEGFLEEFFGLTDQEREQINR